MRLRHAFIFLCAFLASSVVDATDVVKMACPSPAELSFKKINPYPAENEWLATGNVAIKQGATPSFNLQGGSTCKSAKQLFWMSYVASNQAQYLLCFYIGLDDQGYERVIRIINPKMYPILRNCHFEQGNGEDCDERKQHCILDCH